ncbi:MAG: hypothetical protein ACP5U1_03690 [Desulfomonilaceae bacterium]
MRKVRISNLLKPLACFVLATGLIPGCASISRMQNNMDLMTYYMGVVAQSMPQMAFSTKRMADTAEGLQKKSDGMMADFQKKGVSTERAVQNYAQTFIDNDRAIIKNLQGIKEELAQIRAPHPQAKPSENFLRNQEQFNATIAQRLGKMESQIQSLSDRINKQKQ